MKQGLTSLDCLALARELQATEGAKFEKAFQPARDEVVLRLRQPGEGTREWRIKAGKWAYLSQGTKDWPEALTPFATTLRQHLDGARLAGARQVGFDRLLELEFSRAAGSYVLACELFGEGNVVLVKEGRIVQGLRFMRVAHRTVGPGEPWVHPPSRVDPLAATDPDLEARLLGSKADAVRTLATEWNLGGQLAEEVCARAGVDKKAKAARLAETQRRDLARALRDTLEQVRDRPEPVVVRDGAAMVDATPVPLRALEHLSFEARGSFHQALEDYFTAFAREHAPAEDPRAAALRAERERLTRQAEAQEQQLGGFEAQAGALRAAGDLLYARFQEVEAFLAAARAERAAKGGFPALVGFEAHGLRVTGADGASGTVTADLAGTAVELVLEADVHANAERTYEAAKRQREKGEGARTALAETRQRLAEMDREGAALAEKLARERARRRFEPTKRMWFEAYRWFVSSEGLLVLAGRDAQSNDKLVKKHLEANDRYVHADASGAPSVVVKRGAAPEVGEATLREAGAFAVAWSKAWTRRIGSAEAYWVTPEQVSKTPQAGEYLAKGAFIVRGKRTFLSSPLRAAVGEVEVDGHRKVMGGPVEAVAARASRYVVLEPGTESPNDLAKRLAEAFEVPLEEVQAVLPPGGVQVVEEHLAEAARGGAAGGDARGSARGDPAEDADAP